MNETLDLKKSPIGDFYSGNISEENRLRILLLEDLLSDAELVSYYIGEINVPHEIVHVTNKNDFFTQIDEFSPHFIVSDFQLPQFTGKEALIHVREISPYVPFIMCTGRINEETAVECIKLGADDYVLKDDLTRLPSAIISAIEAKKTLIQKDVLTNELVKREENLRAITENSPSNIYTIDNSGKVLFFNNIKPNSTIQIGDSVFDHTGEQNFNTIKEKIKECYEQKKNVEFEIKGDGFPPNTNWYSCKMGPVLSKGEVSQLVFIPHDVTELKKAQMEMAELNSRLNMLNNHLENVRDEEKKKIAMEIHDQLGQELTGNKLGLYWLQQNMTNAEPKVAQKISDLIELSTQIIGTVRRIAHELRPVVLDDIGLAAALEWHINNYNNGGRATSCELILDLDNEEFEKEISTTLYRIVQESLTNVDKHAEAEKVIITLKKEQESIHLTISDNGKGMNKEEALKSKSMGLFGMQERVKRWNGKFDLDTSTEGTTINIELNAN